jgi:hypothetical protein
MLHLNYYAPSLVIAMYFIYIILRSIESNVKKEL